MPKSKRGAYTNRLGEIRKMNCGDEAMIISYINSTDISVQFLDDFGYIVEHAEYWNFKRGTIKNPFHKNEYGAYIGIGNNAVSINRKSTKAHDTWIRMLERCFSEEFKERFPTYKNVVCCDEWLCFQTFADWYNSNYYEVEGQSMELDKDWIKIGNKIYCPEYCSIVPSIVNSCVLNHDKVKYENLPTGICVHNDKYCVRLSMFGERKVLCHTEDLLKGMEIYKQEKIKYVKQVANRYKYCLPKEVYDNMMNYEDRFEIDYPEYKGV